jgi:hypothetical protein
MGNRFHCVHVLGWFLVLRCIGDFLMQYSPRHAVASVGVAEKVWRPKTRAPFYMNITTKGHVRVCPWESEAEADRHSDFSLKDCGI